MKQFPNALSQTLKSSKRKLKEKRNSLTDKKSLDEGRKIKIKVKCNHSKESIKDYFSNKIGAKDLATPIRSDIKKILDLDEKEIYTNDLFFDFEGTLERNRIDSGRIERILNLYGESFQKEFISKCTYRESIFKDMPKSKGDLLRIFTKPIINGQIEIILIDPHHLVATEEYKKLFAQTRNQHKYCISELKKLNKYDF